MRSMKTRAVKASHAGECLALEQIPNIGTAMAADLRLLGIDSPLALSACDPHQLYLRLCDLTGLRQDPCVLDTFLAAVDFMHGGPPRPWWHYTAARKSHPATTPALAWSSPGPKNRSREHRAVRSALRTEILDD